jgi:phosphatidylglycerol lysyltransferase
LRLSTDAAPHRLYRGLAILATVSIGGLTLAALYHALHDISYRSVIDSLASMRGAIITAALAATAVSFIVALANDFVALRYARARSPIVSTILASFCGYALSNFVGFALLSGSAVRYRFYAAAGVSAGKIARITIFIAAGFGVGAVTTIGLGLALRAGEIADVYGLPYKPLCLTAVLILGTTIALLVGCALRRQNVRLGSITIELPSLGLVLGQMAVTILDIVIASSVLWVLLPRSGIDFPAFVVTYTVALSLGFISHAPGGIGVFEAVILYAVGTLTPPSAVVAALVAYRTIYFLLPFAIATLLLTASEMRRLQGQHGPRPAATARSRHGPPS